MTMVHENYSLGGMQNKLMWWDDFLGDSLADEWRPNGSAGGAAAVVDGISGGVVRITPDSNDGDFYQLDWNVLTLSTQKNLCMEVRVRENDASETTSYIQLRYDNDNRLYFINSTADWNIRNENNNNIKSIATGVTPTDGGWNTLRIETRWSNSTGASFWYIDGTQYGPTTGMLTNYPNTAGKTAFDIRLSCENDNEGVAEYIEVDYVVVKQDI